MGGNRVAKSEEGGSKLPLIVAGCAIGVLAAAYLGLCAWANSREAILPNVSVAGVDVSNMSLEQARDAVKTAVSEQGKDVTLVLYYLTDQEVSEELNGAAVAVDADRSAQNAWQVGRENFLVGGAQLAGHYLGISSSLPLVLPEDEPALADLMERTRQAISAASDNHSYYIEGDRLVMEKGAPIVTVDWDAARTMAEESLQRGFAQRFSGEFESVVQKVVPPSSRTDAQDPDFDAIRRELVCEPRDAALDLETMEISDHVMGVDFDVDELKKAYENAEGGETFSIPVTLTRPKVTREDLEGQLFRDVLGEGTTRVSGSANRKHNVKLAAEACNDIVILPGEEFSYNTCTGSRTEAKGYKSAPIYAGGKSVEGIGGGVCQPSSTIYLAVLHTTLEVVERHYHQFNTGYVDPGMDATVYYGVDDLRFKNNTDYPVKVVTNSYDSNGVRYLNVKIYGTNVDGRYAVPKSTTFDWVSPSTVYKPDESVPRGALVLDREQYAYTGLSAHTYRYIYDKDGNELEKQDMGGSKYAMRPNTYYYNPADGDPSTWVNGKPADPGTTDPGTTDPGTTDPGTTDPGTTDPGTVEPEPDPSDSGLDPIDPNAA